MFYLCSWSIRRKENNKISFCLRSKPTYYSHLKIFPHWQEPFDYNAHTYCWTRQRSFNASIKRTGRKTCFFYIYKLTGDLRSSCSGEITLLSDTLLLSQEDNKHLEWKSNSNWFSSIVRHATAKPGTERMVSCCRLWTHGGATRAGIYALCSQQPE